MAPFREGFQRGSEDGYDSRHPCATTEKVTGDVVRAEMGGAFMSRKAFGSKSRYEYGVTVLAALFAVGGCRTFAPPPVPAPAPQPEPPKAEVSGASSFEATAYSIEGETASGEQTRKGIAAGDPRVLPIGSRIRVQGAGQYDGDYTVKDTGREIKGREIDIYIANDAEAKRFGRKTVSIEMLERGNGQRSSTP
jgi:3D (Asp-Asp-Asp) domain-containing protein